MSMESNEYGFRRSLAIHSTTRREGRSLSAPSLDLFLDIKDMSLQMRQPGVVLRDEEAVRLRDLLKDAHNDFLYVSKRIKKEEMRMKTIMKAIQMAEPPLAEAKKSLEDHETSLGSLLSIQEQISSLYPVPNVVTPISHKVSNVETSARAYQARIIPGLKEQIDSVQAEKEETEGRVRILEAEVEGLQFILDQTKKVHESLSSSLSSVEAVSRVLSKALVPITRIPAEVWTAIFKFTIRVELNFYKTREFINLRRNTTIILLHVCRLWRDIIMNEPRLWTVIIAPSQNQLSRGATQLLGLVLGRTRSPITLLSNASRLFGDYQVKQENGIDLIKDNEFGITIDTDSGSFSNLGIQSVHPAYFRAASITLDGNHHTCLPYFLNSLRSFERMKTLTVNSRTQFQGVVLYNPSRQLRTLTLSFQLFGWQFPIQFDSIEALVELHIRQEADQQLPQIQNVALRQLQTLGITTPAINFLENLEAPRLERLIYYGPMDTCKVEVPAGDNGLTKYHRLTSVEFEDWKEPTQRDEMAGAVGLFRNVLPKTHSVSRVKFTDSYIDGGGLLAAFGIGDVGDGVKATNGVEEVTLNRCSGITRDHCDRLKAVVRKLNIYV